MTAMDAHERTGGDAGRVGKHVISLLDTSVDRRQGAGWPVAAPKRRSARSLDWDDAAGLKATNAILGLEQSIGQILG